MVVFLALLGFTLMFGGALAAKQRPVFLFLALAGLAILAITATAYFQTHP